LTYAVLTGETLAIGFGVTFT